MKPKRKRNVANGFKTYVFVMQEIWKFITIMLIGVAFGYLLKLKGPEGNHFMVIVIIISLFVALIVFFVGLFRIIKREEEKEEPDEQETK